MKKDEYSFLELFGNIDDEYIVQALQPWKRQTRRYMVYHIGRKAVCLAIIVMLGLCLAFHDQVYAAVSRFTTMIAEILQISNDLEPFSNTLVKMRTCRLKEIIAKLNQILTGYYHYYGITDNTECITAFRYNIMRSLFYCLNRRSQKKSYNWVEFLNMLDNSYPLVRPRIYVNIYE